MSKLINGKKEFEKALKSKDKVLVLFYAEWCPFSQRFLPVFEKYAKDRSEILFRITADENPDIFDDFEVDVYPTVLFFEKGKLLRRLDGESGVGLHEKELTGFMEACKI